MNTLETIGPTSGREVPDYRVDVLGPRRAAVALCVPVINEGARIERQLRKMAPLTAGTVDVVIADGGSTDGSLQLDRLASHGVRCLLTKTGPGRLGAQIRMAFDWSLDQGYDAVILIDDTPVGRSPANFDVLLTDLDLGGGPTGAVLAHALRRERPGRVRTR